MNRAAGALVAVVLALAVAAPASAELLYTSNRCGTGGDPTCRPGIWRADDDGSNQERILEGGGSPAWDLLGRRIFYAFGSSETGGATRIWSMDPDGGDRRPMTPPGEGFFSELNPAVSADGSLVAFDSNRGHGGGNPQVWVMNADGSQLRQLTAEGGASRLPQFSPDGQRVIYLHYAGGLPGGSPSVRTRLVAGGPPLEVVDASRAIGPFGLSFSLDGRAIALSMHGALYTIDALTGEATRRAPSGSEVTWSLDGTLFYSAADEGYGVIHRMPTGPLGGTSTRIIEHANGPVWSALALELPPLPDVDDLAPALALPDVDGVPGLLAIDPSGVRSLRAGLARTVRGRCRPLARGRLRAPRSCRRRAPLHRVDARRFDRTVRRLPSGRYRVWLRATDGAGNAGRRTLGVRIAR